MYVRSSYFVVDGVVSGAPRFMLRNVLPRVQSKAGIPGTSGSSYREGTASAGVPHISRFSKRGIPRRTNHLAHQLPRAFFLTVTLRREGKPTFFRRFRMTILFFAPRGFSPVSRPKPPCISHTDVLAPTVTTPACSYSPSSPLAPKRFTTRVPGLHTPPENQTPPSGTHVHSGWDAPSRHTTSSIPVPPASRRNHVATALGCRGTPGFR